MTTDSSNVELLREGTEAYNRGDMTFVLSRAPTTSRYMPTAAS